MTVRLGRLFFFFPVENITNSEDVRMILQLECRRDFDVASFVDRVLAQCCDIVSGGLWSTSRELNVGIKIKALSAIQDLPASRLREHVQNAS